jgi:predicted Zn-dependent peptidase
MGELLQMFDGPFATADTFKAVVQYGYGFEYFTRLKNTILTITPEQLMELANKYFITEKLTTVVAGKY